MGKTKTFKNDIQKRMAIDGIEIYDQNKTANGFNKYFTKIWTKLASSIPVSSKVFKQFMNVSKTLLQEYALMDEELEKAFNSLKSNKSSRFNDISSSVVKFCASGIFNQVKHIFNLSLQTGIFPNGIKIARVSIISKKGEEFFFTNYRSISVLPGFSKRLERIMYKRLYKYLLQNNIFYEKQFGLKASNSMEHAVIELISKILDAFNKNKYTLGILIDLCKEFDTVDHDKLLKKLDIHGIKGQNLKWFHSYLTNRKQFITCPDQNTDLEVLGCGVSQDSILEPLLFLIFVNDLKN